MHPGTVSTHRMKLIVTNHPAKREKPCRPSNDRLVCRKHGRVIGIDQFGASAKGDKVIEEYGFTVENVVSVVEGLVK